MPAASDALRDAAEIGRPDPLRRAWSRRRSPRPGVAGAQAALASAPRRSRRWPPAPCRSTIGWPVRASAAQSRSSGVPTRVAGGEDQRLADAALRRRDAGARQRPEGRGDARAGCGTARRRAPAPAPPRRRGRRWSGRRPSAAARAAPLAREPTISALISSCGVEGWPRRLPTKCSSARRARRAAPPGRPARRRPPRPPRRARPRPRASGSRGCPARRPPARPARARTPAARGASRAMASPRLMPARPAEPPLVGGVVERALAEPLRREARPDEDHRRAVDRVRRRPPPRWSPSVPRTTRSSGQLARATTATGQSAP